MQHKDYNLIDKIESFINKYIEEKTTSPTVVEIAQGVGSTRATVSRYLAHMRDEGIIEYSGHRNYSVVKSKLSLLKSAKIPILGSIACGIPKFAEENIEEYVSLPVAIFGDEQMFILRASGDSMIDAGICDGDLVVIKQQNYAESGQIVVALVGEEATLKRFFPEPENNRIRLHPENSTMEDIFVETCEIQGVVSKVIKDM